MENLLREYGRQIEETKADLVEARKNNDASRVIILESKLNLLNHSYREIHRYVYPNKNETKYVNVLTKKQKKENGKNGRGKNSQNISKSREKN